MTLDHHIPDVLTTAPAAVPTTSRAWTPGEPIVLRPHNLLCLQGWQGMGYSPEFTQNMDQIWLHLRRHPQAEVTLRTAPDVLCHACPLNTSSGCQHDIEEEGWISAHDRNTLLRAGLAEGQRYTWKEVETAIARAFQAGDIATFCAQCRWQPLGVCAEGIAQLHTRQARPDSWS